MVKFLLQRLSKGTSDLKRKCTRFLPPFSGTTVVPYHMVLADLLHVLATEKPFSRWSKFYNSQSEASGGMDFDANTPE